MKKIIQILIFLFCLTTINGQEPVITMSTTKAVGQTFSFSLAASADNITIQVDFGDGTKIDKIIGTSAMAISSTLVGSQTIKIYGQGIIYIDCSFNQLATLDVNNNIALRGLNCSRNQLTNLDVSNNTSLIELYCNYNQLKTLVVSNNLALERLSVNNNQLTNLDVSNNIALESLSCGLNQLITLDVINNVALTSLTCQSNLLTTLDITNNIALEFLNCSLNRLKTLDVSNSTALENLDCSINQLSTLVVINNISLKKLYCTNNEITTLDVSNNSALTNLECGVNQLTTLDVNNNALMSLDCSSNQLTTLYVSNSSTLLALFCENNQLTLATLPLRLGSWNYYTYAPQKPIFIGKEINVGVETDLSSQLAVNGNTTVYSWKTKDGTTLTEGVDYTITNGKTIFLKSQADSVYCEMTNATFPGFIGNNALKTSNVKILGTTSLEPDKFKDNGLYIYPNPASNIINVEGISIQNAELSIFNALGKLMLKQKTENGNTQVNIGQLPKGVYMLQITNGTRKIVRKIIKE